MLRPYLWLLLGLQVSSKICVIYARDKRDYVHIKLHMPEVHHKHTHYNKVEKHHRHHHHHHHQRQPLQLATPLHISTKHVLAEHKPIETELYMKDAEQKMLPYSMSNMETLSGLDLMPNYGPALFDNSLTAAAAGKQPLQPQHLTKHIFSPEMMQMLSDDDSKSVVASAGGTNALLGMGDNFMDELAQYEYFNKFKQQQSTNNPTLHSEHLKPTTFNKKRKRKRQRTKQQHVVNFKEYEEEAEHEDSDEDMWSYFNRARTTTKSKPYYKRERERQQQQQQQHSHYGNQADKYYNNNNKYYYRQQQQQQQQLQQHYEPQQHYRYKYGNTKNHLINSSNEYVDNDDNDDGDNDDDVDDNDDSNNNADDDDNVADLNDFTASSLGHTAFAVAFDDYMGKSSSLLSSPPTTTTAAHNINSFSVGGGSNEDNVADDNDNNDDDVAVAVDVNGSALDGGGFNPISYQDMYGAYTSPLTSHAAAATAATKTRGNSAVKWQQQQQSFYLPTLQLDAELAAAKTAPINRIKSAAAAAEAATKTTTGDTSFLPSFAPEIATTFTANDFVQHRPLQLQGLQQLQQHSQRQNKLHHKQKQQQQHPSRYKKRKNRIKSKRNHVRVQ